MRRLNRPEGARSRGDALAGSPHTRLVDQLRYPTQDHDPERAADTCAAVCRQAMLDLAPALMLLSRPTRLRAQALAAYTITLFDFARQPGLEGERLAGLNRWQFELEQALDGTPTGQPVFVRLAAEERKVRWQREEFDRLHIAARRIAVGTLEDGRSAPERVDLTIVDSWLRLISGSSLHPSTLRQAASVLKLHRLLSSQKASVGSPEAARDRYGAELDKIRSTLEMPLSAGDLAPDQAAAAAYLRRASLALLDQTQRSQRPKLGVLRRISILLLARWTLC